MSRFGRYVIAAGLVCMVTAACGTTVPLTTTTQAGNGAGLDATTGGTTGSAQAPGAGQSLGPVSRSGSSGGVTGQGGSPSTVGVGSPGSAPADVAAPGSAKRPVKLGFLMIDYSGVAASFGFSGSTDIFQAFKEMVSYLNKHGGLAGRQIKADYYSIDGTSSDANAAYQAACTHFVQDVGVEAVISDGNFNPNFEACIAKAHLAHIDVSTYGLDATGQRQFPAYLTPTAYGVDRYSAAEVETAVASGWVKAGQKIGVLIEGCDANVRAYNSAWVPTTKRYGLQVESVQTVCNNGTGDLPNETSQIQGAVLKFRSDGVTTVSFVSFNEGFLAVLFSQGAEQQKWRPQYLMSSVALPERGVESQGSALSVPPAQLANIKGLGWAPITDVGGSVTGSAAQEAQKRLCKQMSPSQGGAANAPDSGVRRDFIGHYLRECDTMLLVRQLMTLTGGQLTLPALTGAYARALDGLVSASDANGGYRVSASRTDGVFAGAPFAYTTSCSCMRYTGPVRSFS